jgi:hypothetical protein
MPIKNTIHWGAAALIALGGLASACGNSNIETTDEAGIALETPANGRLTLALPSNPNQPQEQATRLRIRSIGEADLRITGVEWLAKPDRLVLRKSSAEVADCDSECTPDLCVRGAASNTCIEEGVPEIADLSTQSLYDFVFFVKAGGGELNCPSAPDSINPEYVSSDYCGTLEVSTNANTSDGDLIENGKLQIHFYTGGTSGEIRLTPDFIQFTNVAPGFSDTRTFSIENIGSSPLSVRSITSDRPQFITIAGNTNTELSPGGSEQYTLQYTVPQGASPDVLDFTTQVVVDSSAINAGAGTLLVSSDTSAAATPAIQVDEATLSFDAEATQTFNISNLGGATLQVTDLRISPSSAADFYTITVDGAPASTPLNILRPGQGEPGSDTQEVSIAFARPAGNPDGSSVATLTIQSNDFQSGPQRIVLLGDEGAVPVGVVQPTAFTFTTQGEASKSRTFAITNRGSAPLEITDAPLVALAGSNTEYEVTLPSSPLTVAPGETVAASLSYRVADAEADTLNLDFTTADGEQSDDFAIFVQSFDSANAPTAAITKSFANEAKVGELTTFSADGSTPASALSGAQWFLTKKPAGSKLFVSRVGESVSLVPDVAGDYAISVVVSDTTDAQEVLEFTASP